MITQTEESIEFVKNTLKRFFNHYSGQTFNEDILKTLRGLLLSYERKVVELAISNYILKQTWIRANLLRDELEFTKKQMLEKMGPQEMWNCLQENAAKYGYTRKPKVFAENPVDNTIIIEALRKTYPHGWVSFCTDSATFNRRELFLENCKNLIEAGYGK